MENKSENKICQNCKKDFVIEQEDFNFYEKIQVPPPTWCPECRLVRRLNSIRDRCLFKDVCALCKKNIISTLNPEDNFIVYCNKCWWGDGWDPFHYGLKLDFTKPFLAQFIELQKKAPYPATDNRNCDNCDYCDTTLRCKDCILTFGGFQSINSHYCETVAFSHDLLDCDIVFNGASSYETINSNGVYNTKFVYFSDECLDSALLFNCVGCSDCFGCVNLRNKKFCIFNKQYTKEDYKKEIKKWDLRSHKTILEAKEKFWKLYYKTPRRFALVINSNNVTGDDIKNTKNCQNCFATRHGVENCKNIFTCGLLLKDSYDTTTGGETSELFYETASCLESQRVMFSHGTVNCRDVQYSNRIYNCSNCFGCTMLKNKKYCILNKQYTKEEYERLISKIKEHMDKIPYVDKKERIYKYGEFLPSDHPLWVYNESWGNQFHPKTKEQVLEEGYSWREPLKKDYKITLSSEKLPDSINEVKDSILDEAIECEHKGECNEQCTTAFRILPYELEFYRSMGLALPRLCFNCRYYQRLKIINLPKLYHRKCMCSGIESSNKEYKNTVSHFHEDKPCSNEFETAINDERKEIVYCKECYQAEFV